MCINKKIIKFISLLFPFLLGGMVVFFAEKEDGTNNVAEAELFTEEKSMMQQNKVEVVNVYDGDSLDVLGSNGKKIKLRLYGIDAPEKGQNFSQSAKVFLEDTVKDKLYSLDVRYKDNRFAGRFDQERFRMGLSAVLRGYYSLRRLAACAGRSRKFAARLMAGKKSSFSVGL